jgi:AcrR family transcriptional regulator
VAPGLAHGPVMSYSMNVFSERVHPEVGARARQKAATRQKLLRTARRLFARHGFEGTTMRQLASEAKVALGTVFVHFQDKHALLAATLHEGVETALAEGAHAPSRKRLGPRERLLRLAEPLYRHYAENPELSRVLLKEGLFVAGEAGQKFDLQLEGFRRAVEAVYAELDVDAPLASTAFMAFYLFALVAGLRGTAASVAAQLALLGSLVDQQLAGFAPGGRRSR